MSATVTPPPTSLVQVVPVPGEVPGAVIKGLVGVMDRIRAIAKDATNTKDNYKFVYYGDVLAKVQDALVEEGLAIAQRQVSMKVQDKILMILYTFDVYHSSGACIYNIASHTGACRFEFKSGATDDKAASKCMQSALKYTLLSLFKIPPDDAALEKLTDGDADAQGVDDDPGERNGRRDRNGNGGRRREPDRDRRDDLRDERRPDRGFRDPAPPDDDAALGNLPAGPPSDPTSDTDFEDRVRDFKRKLHNAQNERDAALLWQDDAKLVRQLANNTYDFLREEYNDRWRVYPPAV